MSEKTVQRAARGGGARPSPNPVAAHAGRYLAWAVAILLLLAALWGGWRSLQRIFLRGNPRFTLRHVEVIINGELRKADITTFLERRGVRVHQTNLFAIDLRAQREALSSHVMVAAADFRVRLPDTLVVEVTERVPVARLMSRSQRLLDAEGWLLPPRDPEKTAGLPIVFGARSGPGLQEGARVTDEMVLSALNLIRLLSIRPYGRFFDLAAIQLDYTRGTLRMHLRPRGIFRERAQVLLPAKAADLEEALVRVEIITRDRTRARQETGFIDATYRKNVPVLP